METIIYLLKVSACTTLFFALYLLFLRRLTFFKFNRFYLLLTLLASFIIPALNFTIEREVATVVEVNEIPVVTPQETMVPLAQSPIPMPAAPIVQQSVDWSSVLSNLYFIVAGCLLALAIWQILQLFRYTKNAAEQINGLKVVAKTGGLTNCSFFNYVFVDNESLTANEVEILLKHEAVHAKQLHSVDKLVLAVAKAFLWFNPVVYLYDNALEQNHEYEADEATSLSFGAAQYANLLLRLVATKNQTSLVHNFVKSPIKERIKMLFNPKSNHMKKLIYLLVLPVGLGLLWGFTVKFVNVAPKINDEKIFTLVLDAGHGGDAKGAQMNGVAEKDITLTMANKIKALAEAKGIKVVTTRETDENVSLNDRAKAEGTILISLHVNSSPKSTTNGIEMICSGSYENDDDFKLPKSNSITYFLYKELKKINGIKVSNKPKYANIFLLNKASMPGVILELGYLTNKSDLKFITNENGQAELAKLIVDGILVYKEKLPASEAMRLEFKTRIEEFRIKRTEWENSEKYKKLVEESKNFKAQTLLGTIKSLNYFKRGTLQVLDGFIIDANGKSYRVYLSKAQLNVLACKVGDKIAFYASNPEVWFDSDYPVFKPKKVSISSITSIRKLVSASKLISASTLNVDNINIKTYETLNANKNAVKIKKNANQTTKNNTASPANYVVNKSSEVEHPTFSAAYQMLKDLKAGNHSLKLHNLLGELLLSGEPNLNLDGYSLNAKVFQVNKDSNLITAHVATLICPNGTKLSADVIEFNPISKNYKAVNASGTVY